MITSVLLGQYKGNGYLLFQIKLILTTTHLMWYCYELLWQGPVLLHCQLHFLPDCKIGGGKNIAYIMKITQLLKELRQIRMRDTILLQE